ncbi:QVR superfamily protein rtv [Musca autumnalis]|uniref:QVR superfamily protein rtv n=1 Tax=Musca autumnalis TaxID=221902 RepID=UPI003CF87111
MLKLSVQITVIIILISTFNSSDALLRRCFQCRSRGELGSCKDPFTFNATDVEKESGVTAIPCASGWCGKVIEGGGTYAVDDYDQAIQRMCVQRGPDDNQDRCANTVYNYKKVYMCFCQGDLCNGSETILNHKNAMKMLGLAVSMLLTVNYRFL